MYFLEVFGLKELRQTAARDVTDMSRSGWRDGVPKPGDLCRTVSRVVMAEGWTDADAVARACGAIDCRLFADQDARTSHIGGDWGVLKSVIWHAKFTEWCQFVRRELSRLEDCVSSGNAKTVAIYCERGKHRSVACSLILKTILEGEGATVSTHYHSETIWSERGAAAAATHASQWTGVARAGPSRISSWPCKLRVPFTGRAGDNVPAPRNRDCVQ